MNRVKGRVMAGAWHKVEDGTEGEAETSKPVEVQQAQICHSKGTPRN